MKTLFSVTGAELRKSFKGKGWIITVCIIIGINLFLGLLYGMTVAQYAEMFPSDEENDNSLYDPAEVLEGVELAIEENNLQYEQGEINYYEHAVQDYQNRALKTALEYQIKKGVSSDSFIFFMSDDMLRNATWYYLLTYLLSSSSLIIAIVASVLAAGAINDEISSGTMRLVLTTPVGRIKLMCSKLINIITQLAFYIILTIVSALLIGLLMYAKGSTPDVMIIFNASSALIVPFFVTIIIQSLSLLIFGTIVAIIVMMFAVIFRNKIFGIIVGVVLSVGIIPLALTKQPRMIRTYSWSIFANMDFTNYFALAGNPFGQKSIILALIIAIVESAVLLALTALVFSKKDIN
jgi:ABC-2 type transport system permease protein